MGNYNLTKFEKCLLITISKKKERERLKGQRESMMIGEMLLQKLRRRSRRAM